MRNLMKIFCGTAGRPHRLLPVRVEEVELPPLMGNRVWLEFVGLDQDRASELLLQAAADTDRIPTTPPDFPTQQTPDSDEQAEDAKRDPHVPLGAVARPGDGAEIHRASFLVNRPENILRAGPADGLRRGQVHNLDLHRGGFVFVLDLREASRGERARAAAESHGDIAVGRIGNDQQLPLVVRQHACDQFPRNQQGHRNNHRCRNGQKEQKTNGAYLHHCVRCRLDSKRCHGGKRRA